MAIEENDDECPVCEGTGTYYMDEWGYCYGAHFGGRHVTAHRCSECLPVRGES